jgi:hypothetical protein
MFRSISLCLSFGPPYFPLHQPQRPIAGRRDIFSVNAKDMIGNAQASNVAARLDFEALGNIFRPVLNGIEGDDADRVR